MSNCHDGPNQGHNPGSLVCVRRYDDLVFVKDTEADGRGATGEVQRVDSDGFPKRYCFNGRGTGLWIRCNFDWQENAPVRYAVYGYEFDNPSNTAYFLILYFGFDD
jgi:hypothetical protein